MMMRRPDRFRTQVSWSRHQRSESSPESSDEEEEEERGAHSPSFTDDDSGSEGELESPQLEFEPELTGGMANFRNLARRARGNSLLKLVNSKQPDVGQANILLSDLTPEQISKEIATKDGRGNSVIHYACMKTLVPWVEMLIQHGADLDVRGAGGKRPIHFAVRDKVRVEGQAQDKAKLVKLLVAKNIKVNMKDNLGQTPLLLACKFEGQKIMIKALLSHPDVRIDQPLRFGRVNSTLLTILCHNGQFEAAILLLENGANPLAVNAAKNTPFYIILKKGNVKYALRFLSTCQRRGCDMQKILLAQNIYQKTVLHEAIKTGSQMLIRCCMTCVRPVDQSEGGPSNYLLDFKSRFGSTIMHTACKHGHLDIVHMLHDLCPRLLDTRNAKGLTPLHYACRGNYAEVAEELCIMLQSHDIDLRLNLDDEIHGSQSLLKFTASTGSSDCLVVLLRHANPDLSIMVNLIRWISVEKNLSLVLQELLNSFDDISTGCESMEIEKIILLCAAKGQTESLLEFVGWHRRYVFLKDSQENTVMHLIAQGGHFDTAKALLKNQDDVGLCEQNHLGQTPLHLAIKRGHKLTTKLFLKTNKVLAGMQDNKGMTPLMYACKVGNILIVEMLLEQNQGEIRFFECDRKGRNCLDHAIRNGHEMVAVTLLSQENWRSLMAHSTGEGANKTTPMRNLITTMPGRGNYDDTGDTLLRTISTLGGSDHNIDEESIQKDESKMLLNHPVVRLMIRYKNKSTRLKYWISLFLHFTLVVLVTGHSLVIPPPFYVQTNPEGNNYTWLADGKSKWQENMNLFALVLFGRVGAWIILALTVIYFIEFVYRVVIYRHTTLNNIRGVGSILREVALVVFITLFIVPGLGDLTYGYGVNLKPDWQWQLGAFAVFLTWFNFILFLQTVPFFGLYIFMFLEVLSTLLNFIFVVGIFAIAFAVVFCILLLNQAPFHTVANSLAKILAMASGEPNFDAVFHSLDYLYQPVASVDFTSMVFYPASTHIIFFLFIFFMPILIMNLLTGLAVYDIEIIQKKAIMCKRTLEAKGILDVQDNSVLLIWKRSVLRDQVKSIRTEISPMHKLFYKAIGYKEIHDQLVAFLEELEKTGSVQFTKTTEMKIEDMAQHICDMRNKLNMLSENAIDSKIEQLETMTIMQEIKQQMQALQDS
ncbi:transient receptor potential cation channel subfamily A member 1 homolog isoform X5 [Strongylocentrotus purpuratus]|uniref:Ion transport domain-containing protein n=1 Tax=Strongylocentrotus purpuratus TaxID=7668 RepID=A0A7M7PDB8_STRPU|nr:transient receptor potential cation channel subfamily A member 1 homolog isoform X5 [Strongylocentrotus purpuratus]